ncbi:hypothetical protein PAXRUDRAFT_613755 [Paxillus rubicundulus Ve08.2h10]|uniref:Uncharacterized protein n=1 Tax=Paxillus rubicundulus Ve08.2h10 TaxID=930991 RepID=A0A0D0E8Z5_9AGAM|nr:hypothetical protein PAXRUDRAFT_613755 [Paxillus rubicundulus Ve08.2h10]
MDEIVNEWCRGVKSVHQTRRGTFTALPSCRTVRPTYALISVTFDASTSTNQTELKSPNPSCP